MYVWDLDDTLFQNIYKAPDWDDPLAIHPETRESVTSQMPIYNQGVYLNPDLEGVNLIIDTVLTARPEYRRAVTLDQLKKLTNNIPATLIMYPSQRRYSHNAAIRYKLNHLDFIAQVSNDTVYYIDEDPNICAFINIMELYNFHRVHQVEAISLDQYFKLEAGL